MVIPIAGPPRRVVRANRSADRLIALGAIAVAVASLIAALASTLLPPEVRRGAWLPLHLAMAGAATTAIAGVMPFFSAALAAAPPASATLRSVAVVAVVAGGWAAAIGVVGASSGLAVIGSMTYVAGVSLTGVAVIGPLRHGLGPSRGLVTVGYVGALCSVAIGASLAIVYLAGWPPLLEAWARARPAHAWLNVFGFVSLAIATTLLHFLPTVMGARIVRRRSAVVAVVGIAGGTALVAAGSLISPDAPEAADAMARIGAVVALTGSLGLAVYAGRTWQARARWTSDAGWHRVAMGGLVSAIAWFLVGVAIGAGRILVHGADPAGWAFEAVAGPLMVGWVGLAIVASATHLVPAVGPGSPVAHAHQRAILGRAGTTRLVAIDLGVAALAIGLPTHAVPLVAVGTLLVALGLGLTAVLMATAIAVGLSREAVPGTGRPRRPG